MIPFVKELGFSSFATKSDISEEIKLRTQVIELGVVLLASGNTP